MLPVARGANGQPPRPPTDASSTRRARLERGERVRVARVARVVEVDADGGPSAGDAPTSARDLARHATPIVSARTISSRRLGEPLGDLEHACRVDARPRTGSRTRRRASRSRRPSRGARDDPPAAAAIASSSDMFPLRRLNVSVAASVQLHLVERRAAQPLVARAR